MADVYDVARFFIYAANQEADDQITNLKLNKLLYYAQGAFLERTGNCLFSDAIEAWEFGPVVPNIYRKYKAYGSGHIGEIDKNILSETFTEEELQALLDVYREYGQYTGAKLVAFTHEPDTPWNKTYENKEKEIDVSLIRDYFAKHPVSKLKDKTTSPVVDALPNEWYDPSEDEVWEAYL